MASSGSDFLPISGSAVPQINDDLGEGNTNTENALNDKLVEKLRLKEDWDERFRRKYWCGRYFNPAVEEAFVDMVMNKRRAIVSLAALAFALASIAGMLAVGLDSDALIQHVIITVLLGLLAIVNYMLCVKQKFDFVENPNHWAERLAAGGLLLTLLYQLTIQHVHNRECRDGLTDWPAWRCTHWINSFAALQMIAPLVMGLRLSVCIPFFLLHPCSYALGRLVDFDGNETTYGASIAFYCVMSWLCWKAVGSKDCASRRLFEIFIIEDTRRRKAQVISENLNRALESSLDRRVVLVTGEKVSKVRVDSTAAAVCCVEIPKMVVNNADSAKTMNDYRATCQMVFDAFGEVHVDSLVPVGDVTVALLSPRDGLKETDAVLHLLVAAKWISLQHRQLTGQGSTGPHNPISSIDLEMIQASLAALPLRIGCDFGEAAVVVGRITPISRELIGTAVENARMCASDQIRGHIANPLAIITASLAEVVRGKVDGRPIPDLPSVVAVVAVSASSEQRVVEAVRHRREAEPQLSEHKLSPQGYRVAFDALQQQSSGTDGCNPENLLPGSPVVSITSSIEAMRDLMGINDESLHKMFAKGYNFDDRIRHKWGHLGFANCEVERQYRVWLHKSDQIQASFNQSKALLAVSVVLLGFFAVDCLFAGGKYAWPVIGFGVLFVVSATRTAAEFVTKRPFSAIIGAVPHMGYLVICSLTAIIFAALMPDSILNASTGYLIPALSVAFVMHFLPFPSVGCIIVTIFFVVLPSFVADTVRFSQVTIASGVTALLVASCLIFYVLHSESISRDTFLQEVRKLVVAKHHEREQATLVRVVAQALGPGMVRLIPPILSSRHKLADVKGCIVATVRISPFVAVDVNGQKITVRLSPPLYASALEQLHERVVVSSEWRTFATLGDSSQLIIDQSTALENDLKSTLRFFETVRCPTGEGTEAPILAAIDCGDVTAGLLSFSPPTLRLNGTASDRSAKIATLLSVWGACAYTEDVWALVKSNDTAAALSGPPPQPAHLPLQEYGVVPLMLLPIVPTA